MNHLKGLFKVIEIELRSGFEKFSKETWEKLSELSEWDYRKVQGFVTEVNLAIQAQDLNFVYKKYNIEEPRKNKIKYDLFIACLKRRQHELILTDVINRLVIPQGVSYKYYEVWGMKVEQARNHSIEQAFAYGCEYILFIDDDMIVENTALVKLWETHKKTKKLVVSADYQKKAEYEVTAHGKFKDTDIDYLKETDLCAMGFTLIHLSEVTKKMPAPYFWVFKAPDGLWAMGEDAFFTQNLKYYCEESPVIDFRISVLHYDKVWKRLFGKRDNSVTYATNSIKEFTTFDHMRVPPEHPLINICIPRRSEEDPIATNLETLLVLRGYKTEFTTIHGKNVDQARNELATNSVVLGSTFTLFIDNDVIVPGDSLVKMLDILEKEEDVAMVVGDYLLKGKIPHSAHLQLDDRGVVTELNRIKDIPDNIDSNWLVGLGCALIRTSVFRQVQYPYFVCMSTKLNKIGVAFEEDGGVNEDAYFTEALFENGYKVRILRDIKCIHVNFKERKMFGYNKEFIPENYSCFEWAKQIQYIPVDNMYET